MNELVSGLAGVVVGGVLTGILQWWITTREHWQQLRLACIERRLEVHQKAYALWRELLFSQKQDNVGDTVMRCQTWWNENCLYLDEKVGDAFRDAFFAKGEMQDCLVEHREELFQKVMRVGNMLRQAVSLPPINEASMSDEIEKSKSTPAKQEKS